MCLDSSPFVSLEKVSQDNGLETTRMIMSRYEPRTAQTKRTHVMTARQSNMVDNMNVALQHLGRNIKVCEDLAGKPLDEDLLAIALPDICVPELRSKLELSSEDMSHREVRGDMVAYIERP